MSKYHFDWNSNHLLKKIFIGLVSCELFIFGMDILLNHYKLVKIGAVRRLFNITREDGVSNFFSSFQLMMVGLVAFVIYWLTREIYDNRHWFLDKGWLVIAGFFTFMGFDDATKFHERMGTTAKKIFANDSARDLASPSIFETFGSYAWQIVFGPFFALMGLFMLWFLLKNLYDKKSKYLFIGGISLYVVAVGMDYVEGFGTGPYEGIGAALDLSAKKVRHLSKAYEETFEMFGTTLFLMSFLRHGFHLIRSNMGLEVKVDGQSS